MKVSVNDIVIKAVALALRNVPEANGNAAPFLANMKLSFFVLWQDYQFVLQIRCIRHKPSLNKFSVKK